MFSRDAQRSASGYSTVCVLLNPSMTFLTAIFAAITPWIQAFFQALLPFLKQQADTPIERTVAEKDPKIEKEVDDAIDQYDRDHHAPSD